MREIKPGRGRIFDRDVAGLALILVLLASVFGLSVYRAANQSITCDEALTYNWFLSESGRLFWFDANNHILHTYLAWLSTSLLGPTEFTLRLPALLGAALYLGAVFYLTRLVVHSPGWALLLVLLLVCNPLVLDFLPAARGYGLALAFLMWGFAFAARSLLPGAEQGWHPRRLWLACSVALGLCVACNLAFLWISFSLAATLFLLTATASRRAPPGYPPIRSLILYLGLPGPLVLLALLSPYLNKIKRAHFYVGNDRLIETLRDLLNASFFRAEKAVSWRAPSHPGVEILPPWALSLGGLALLAALVLTLAPLCRRSLREGVFGLPAADRIALLFGVPPCAALAFHVVAHWLIGLKYPLDRTAIYAVPLFTLAGLFVWLRRESPSRWSSAGVACLALVVVARYLTQLDPTYFQTWKHDAGARAEFEQMARLVSTRATEAVSIGGPPALEPSLTFYKLTRRAGWMAPFVRGALPSPGACDFFLYDPVLYPDLERQGFHMVYRDPVSGIALARKVRPAPEAGRLTP
jgi:hypothetical protein